MCSSDLIAGPATNVTTFGILAKLHGRKVAIAFGAAVACGAVIMGWTVDAFNVAAVSELGHHHHDEGLTLGWLCTVVLLLLSVASLFRQGPRGAVAQIIQPIHSHG